MANRVKSFEIDIPDELINYLWVLFKPRMEALIAEKIGLINSTPPVNDYMPMDWVIQTFALCSRQTFFNVKKGKVHSIKKPVGSGKLYNVDEFNKSLLTYLPQKPLFRKK